MKKKQKDHPASFLFRLFIAFFTILFLVIIQFYGLHVETTYFIFALLLVSLIVDVFDHRYAIVPSFLKHAKEHKNHFSPRSFLLLGALVSLGLFNHSIVFAALSMTVVGTVGGNLMRDYPLSKKRFPPAVQGLLLAFVFNILAGMIFVSATSIILPMAAMAAIIENYASQDEDYLLIPVFATIIGQIMAVLFWN